MTEMDRPHEMPMPAGHMDESSPPSQQQPPYQPTDPSSTLLSLPMTLSSMQTPSEKTGLSTQSMRTSSFAMSDESKPHSHSQNLESLTIRKAYSRPPTIRSKYRSSDIVQETEKADYFDEKDFGNTDRYFASGSV